MQGTSFEITIGGITNTNASDLTSYFGMPSGEYTGAIIATTLSGSLSGDSFACNIALSGDVDDAPTPAPAAAWLFVPGLSALVALRRKFRA